jgi:glutaredoxin-like protein
MPNLIDETIKEKLELFFKELEGPVTIVFFGAKLGCETCQDTVDLMKGVVALSPILHLIQYDIKENLEKTKQYDADKIPFFSINAGDGEDSQDMGVHFAGIPAGHEFSAFINSVIMVSKRKTHLSPITVKYLTGLKEPIHLKVFSTPTCGYCPRAISLAHQMAMESRMVTAVAIEALEFPELSRQYQVSGVPHTFINDGIGSVLGAVPEQQLLEEMQKIIPG